MANGIGKIAMGRQTAQTSMGRGASRGAQYAHRLGTKKRQEDSASRMAILSSLGSLAAGFKQNTESWGKVEQGAKAAGVEMEKASFGDKLLRGFGIQNVDLDKKYKAGDGMWEYSGSELMNIGEKAQTGTLESFLGDKKIGDLYGGATKELQAYQYKGEGGQGLSAMDKGEDFQAFSKKLRGEIDLTEPPEYGKKPYNEETYKQMKAAEATSPLSKEEYGGLIKDTHARREISQEQWEKQAMREQFPVDQARVDARFTDPASFGAGPKDPLRDQRLKIAQGVEEGVFDEGFSLEDLWASNDKRGMRPELPYEELQPDELNIDEMPMSESTIQQDMMGGPEDPLASQRQNLMRNQLGSGQDMTLEELFTEQDRLSELLKPTDLEYDYSPGGLAVSVTGKRK